MPTFLIGYDVEHLDPEVTRPFLRRAAELHREYGVPATLFVLGQTLERNVDALGQFVDDPLFDIQQHTYSHMPLKTLVQRNSRGTELILGGSLDRTREEVSRTSELLEEHLGVRCTGLTGPYTYYRGLADRPDILQVLDECGIEFLRTYGRNEHDWQPVPLEVQPFWYSLQGFPGLLEYGVTGWADCLLREELGWDDHDGYLSELRRNLDLIEERDLVWSYLQHDWASLRGDPGMTLTETLLREVRDRGIEAMRYIDHYERAAAQR
ncbi:polysaccharide deacetylase family protein [Lysobacter korlensis]|uniref:Polysaccharide deacetylase family protein n=1 Tax=Lysobacter korlensis TaxID=553636 RepID=A0ABV6RVG5_9GAMM